VDVLVVALTAGRYDEYQAAMTPGYPGDMGPEDLLPEQTRDDLDLQEDSEADRDEWLREQVPPHHGE